MGDCLKASGLDSDEKQELPSHDASPVSAAEPVMFTDLSPGLELNSIPGCDLLLLSFTKDARHPDDPLCFPFWTKARITLLAALFVMVTVIASSAPSGSSQFIEADLGGNPALVLSMYLIGYVAGPFIGAPASEAWGRKPVAIGSNLVCLVFTGGCAGAQSFSALLALRFCAGFFGSVPLTNSGAVCGDVWSPRERGTAMSFYSVATFAGPALGPIIGSFVALHLTWRWVFIVMTFLFATSSLLSLVACPETYAPVILSRLACRMREERRDERIVSRLQYEEMLSRGTPPAQRFRAEVSRLFGTPLIMLATEPIVGLTTIYMAAAYGLVYIEFEVYPIIFDEVHSLGTGYSSLPFLAILVGALVSVPIQLYFQKVYVRRVEGSGGKHTPEMRLPPAQWGGIVTVAAFIMQGWTGYKSSIPWIVPALSGILQGIGSVLLFRALQTYIVDAYSSYSASAMAAGVVARSLCGAATPLLARPLFDALGVNWACTLLAGVMLALVPVPFIFERYGAHIRKKSRYAPERS